MRKNPGYILVLALIMMSALVVIAAQLFYTGGNFSSFASYAYKREQAKWLAQSGIAFVTNELYIAPPQKKDSTKKETQKNKADESESAEDNLNQTQQLLAKLLPILNRWQTISFTEQEDNVDGTIALYVACEDGKIPINSVLKTLIPPKFEQKPLSMDLELFFDDFYKHLTKTLNTKSSLKNSLNELLEKRNATLLNDVTELLTLEAFAPLKGHVFISKEDQTAGAEPPIYLMDLFTVHGQYAKIDPWTLSAAVRAVYGLGATGERKITESQAKELAKKAQQTQNWQSDWNKMLKPLYNKEFGTLPQSLKALLHTKPTIQTLSVMCYATVGGVTQRTYTILIRHQTPDHGLDFVPICTYLC